MAIIIVIVALPVRAALHVSVLSQDEGVPLLYPTEIVHGAVPNLTFESIYGEAYLWPIAASYAVFGTTIIAERIVALFYWAAIVTIVAVLVGRAKGHGMACAAGCLSAIIIAGGIGLFAFAWLAALTAGLFAVLCLDLATEGRKRWWQFAAGVGLGVAVACRLDLGLATALVLALQAYTLRCKSLPVFFGFAVGLVPLFMNVVQAGIWPVIRGEFIQPVFACNSARRLPFSTLTNRQQLVLVCVILATLALLAAGVARYRHTRNANLLTVAVFALGLLPQTLQRSDDIHIAYVACAVIPLLLMIDLPSQRIATPLLLIGACFVTLDTLAVTYYVRLAQQSLGTKHTTSVLVQNAGRSVYVDSRATANDLDGLLAALDRLSQRGQTVFVGPDDLRRTVLNDTFIYFLLPKLTPGTFYQEMEPWVANARNSRLANQLQRVDWVVLTSLYNNWNEPNTSTHYGSDAANRVIRSQFQVVSHWGPWTLLRNVGLNARSESAQAEPVDGDVRAVARA